MIKINLLAEGKRPAAVRRAKAGGAPTMREWGPWILLFGILVGACTSAAWWWTLSKQRDANAASIREEEAEVRKLDAIIKEVQEYKKKQAELERKISVIKQLQANQKGPVQVMDQISRALPELLWLDTMTMSGSRITLSGQAFNSNAVANFMENLDKVPEFQEPSLQDMSQQTQTYRFTIVFNFSYAEPAPAAGQGAPTDAGGGAQAPPAVEKPPGGAPPAGATPSTAG
jgi:type IV pilus assembly protein PilN